MYNNISSTPPKKAESVEIRRLMTGEEIGKVVRSLSKKSKEEAYYFLMSLSEEERGIFHNHVNKAVEKTLKETDEIIKYGEKEIKELEDFAEDAGKFISNF